MTTVFRATTSADEAALIGLLQRAFPEGPGGAFEPRLMRWKYWEPREGWAEPRSYVLEREGRLVAHAGLWPVTVPGERGIHMIDWASDPQAPGAGVSILQRLTRMFSFVYSIGGSEMTLEILPKVGFQRVAEAVTWARPIRPWRHALRHQSKDLRLGARLARNVWWSKSPGGKTPAGWEAKPLDEPVPPYFRYLQRCPGVDCRVFGMFEQGRPAGYFALSVVQGQARIVRMGSNHEMALRLAQAVALRETDACEITARGVSEWDGPARAAGMRARGREPVLFYRKTGVPARLPLGFELGDNDAAFLSDGAVRFLC